MLEKCHFEEHVMQSGVPLWEKKERLFENVNDQEMVGDYVFRANRSLEHLHPQHQDNTEKWLIECVHSFGNLAMISQSFNSHAENGGYPPTQNGDIRSLFWLFSLMALQN